MKTTKFDFKLFHIKFTKSESDSPPASAKKSSPKGHHAKPTKRKGDPAEERSEMPVTSKKNARAKTPDPKEHKTPGKKVVLAAVLVIMAIIAACTANTLLVNEMLIKLIEIL